jgi:hypothetical protein
MLVMILEGVDHHPARSWPSHAVLLGIIVVHPARQEAAPMAPQPRSMRISSPFLRVVGSKSLAAFARP